MKIELNNVGAILKGNINIEEDKINIKYGLNGIGKSTITKAIINYINNEPMSELRTFGSDIEPKIEISPMCEDVLVFNQSYVDKYLFKEDIVNNTFEILINTSDYRAKSKKIKDMFEQLTDTIQKSSIKNIKEDIDKYLNIVKFKKNKDISNACKLAKGMKVPKFTKVLSESSQKYQTELSDSDNYEWLKWFNSGVNYIKSKNMNRCPLCKNVLPENILDIASEINNLANATDLKNNIEIKQTVGNLRKIIPVKQSDEMIKALENNEKFNKEQMELFSNVYDLLLEESKKLAKLQSLNVSEIRKKFDEGVLEDFLISNKINIELFTSLEKENLEQIIKINESIDDVLTQNKELETLTSDFSKYLNGLVSKKQDYLNNFLEIAGIPYKVTIQSVGNNEYQTALKPRNSEEKVSKESLSYGEKNVISLILFSLEAAKYNFIILDDPVSSFDNNKKFAAVYYLFSKEEAVLKDKTVMLLTHDFDLIIDFFYKNELKSLNKSCNYISNINGELKEESISKNQVKNTLKQWKDKAKSKANNLIRLVNLRKYYEYAQANSQCERNVISSIIHGNEIPMGSVNHETKCMESSKINEAIVNIQKYIENFDYEEYFNSINNNNLKKWYKESSSDIDKLQILRVFLERNPKVIIENHAFLGFVKEAYHVENNELMSLNEKKFNTIPNYIIKICDEIMNVN